MKGSVVRTLVLHDWYRHRLLIVLSILAGALSLTLLQVRSEAAFILGSTWFFVSMVVLGSMLPVSNIINERKKQTLPFLMSFPISVTEYTEAKALSTVGMFLVPWLALVVAAISVILGRKDIPDGIIPITLLLSALPFVGFCLIAGVAMVSESEGWTIAATIFANSSYGFTWYLLARTPAINVNMGGPVPVWNTAVLRVLAGEIAAIAVIFGLTFYLQSRKRDFI